MDIRNILIIYDKNKFTKDSIVSDIKEEEYQHNFVFYDSFDIEDTFEYLKRCDEVWTFGDCDKLDAYKSAIVFGSDIWRME